MYGRIVGYCVVFVAAPVLALAAEPAIDFNRDVRPILADRCYTCHGPDAQQRQANLRLDVSDAAEARGDSGVVLVGGDLAQSELWRRIVSSDDAERMPPPGKGRSLSDREQEILRAWILSGAKFAKHWSLVPVQRPQVPDSAGGNGPLDAFVQRRLTEAGWQPSPAADRLTLLRRVTLGITGLPPTIDEIFGFEADNAPDAYERVVDRLLASPRYGERMASPWLDAARYADTSGYQSDGERFMWRWRDWVIEALNANQPFDQFTIEQIAGDLLPNATLAQRIATGFNRNHRGNAEGGIIPEEYAAEYVADRVETTATVWLGLTLGCARCHDHKYDPFTQRDFYRLFAYFNNVPEKGRAIKIGNSPPFLQAPTRLQEEQRAALAQRLQQAQTVAEQAALAGHAEFAKWWPTAGQQGGLDWYPDERLVAHESFESDLAEERLESEAAESAELGYCAGPCGRAGEFVGSVHVAMPHIGEFGFFDKFTLAAWVKIDDAGGGTIVSRMIDQPQGEGYQLAIVAGKVQFNLVKRWLDDALRVEAALPLSDGAWHHVAASYDGSRIAEGVRLFVDGRPQEMVVLLDELNQTFSTKEPLRIGGGGGPQGNFRGALDDVRVYAQQLSSADIEVLATPQAVDAVVRKPPDKWTAGQARKVRQYFLERHAAESWRAAERERIAAERALDAFEEQLPTLMVMEEMAQPRTTHVLVRGQYDKLGERVEAAVPVELVSSRNDFSRDRLGLARWLVARENPLTSRVAVNRIWQLHFGTGIVKTAEDFGRQGEWPSHPEMLDWLASEFVECAWDVKRLQRTIVTSATYRQSSGFRVQGSPADDLHPEPQTLNPPPDPENRLLWRGPRLRLTAEMVRDQALAASGLLVEQLGGPSVRPLQPAGLWSELTGGNDYRAGNGADLTRRSLYTFWKRTIPPPAMATFDASSREACVVRESRTNTPLQALALLNEPTMVMAAQALAAQVLREEKTPQGRIERAMLAVVGRRPRPEELAILTAAVERYGKRATDEAAAYEWVCSTILNLDEAVTSQ